MKAARFSLEILLESQDCTGIRRSSRERLFHAACPVNERRPKLVIIVVALLSRTKKKLTRTFNRQIKLRISFKFSIIKWFQFFTRDPPSLSSPQKISFWIRPCYYAKRNAIRLQRAPLSVASQGVLAFAPPRHVSPDTCFLGHPPHRSYASSSQHKAISNNKLHFHLTVFMVHFVLRSAYYVLIVVGAFRRRITSSR